jgi:hypothetical protein
MVVRRIVDNDEAELDVLDRIFERKLEEAALKLFTKVYDKKTMEELEARELSGSIGEPVIFFESNGETERVATKEGDGRDTAPGTPGEFDKDDKELADKIKSKLEEGGLEVSATGLVTPKE